MRVPLYSRSFRRAFTLIELLVVIAIIAILAAGAAGWFAQTGDMAYAKMQSLGQIAAQIQQQSMVITYSETFWVLGIALAACVPLALLLKKPQPGAQASSAGH